MVAWLVVLVTCMRKMNAPPLGRNDHPITERGQVEDDLGLVANEEQDVDCATVIIARCTATWRSRRTIAVEVAQRNDRRTEGGTGEIADKSS